MHRAVVLRNAACVLAVACIPVGFPTAHRMMHHADVMRWAGPLRVGASAPTTRNRSPTTGRRPPGPAAPLYHIVTFASKSHRAPNSTPDMASGLRSTAAIVLSTFQFMLSPGPTDPLSDACDPRPSCDNKTFPAFHSERATISRCDISTYHALIGPFTIDFFVNGP